MATMGWKNLENYENFMRNRLFYIYIRLTYLSPNFNLVDFARGGATWLSELAEGIKATKRDGRLCSLLCLPKHLVLFRCIFTMNVCNADLDFKE